MANKTPRLIYDFQETDIKKKFWLLEDGKKIYIPFYKIEGYVESVPVEHFKINALNNAKFRNDYFKKLGL